MYKSFFVCLLAMGIVCGSASGAIFYTYDGSPDAPGGGTGFDALDGTWSHNNGSDEWDGTGIGIGLGRPGGAMSLTEGATTFLRIQDTGDPRDYGMGDPGSTRKVYLGHNLSADGVSDTCLDDGITLAFRARLSTSDPLDDLHPDGGSGVIPFPAPDGYLIHDGGKGSIGLHQNAGGTISFSLVTEADGAGLLTSGGLIMNNLNGNSVTGDVDSGEAGALNFLALDDTTAWHDFKIEIMAGGTGTHTVGISVDGAQRSIST